MFHYPIPLLSSTCGQNNDGIPFGAVNQSTLLKAFSNAILAPATFAYALADDGNNLNITDVSTPIISGTANAVAPFGETAQMSSLDRLVFACDHSIKEFYFELTTSGAGNWGTLAVFDSSDGETATRELAIVSDPSNGMKAGLGVYRVQFTNQTGQVTWSPSPMKITKRRYIAIGLKNFVSATTAPKISRLWIIHEDSAISYVDLTTQYNASTTSNDFTGSPATAFYPIGTERIWVSSTPFYGMDNFVFRRLAQTGLTIEYRFLNTSGVKELISGHTNLSSFFTNGPATLGTTATEYRERWSVPNNWAKAKQTLALTAGGSVEAEGYFLYEIITANSSPALIAPSLARARVRRFGNDNTRGIELSTDLTTKGVLIKSIGSLSAQIIAQVLNLTTGKSSPFTIPASPTLPLLLDTEDITIKAGEKFDIVHTSGGTASSLDLIII